MTTQHAKKHFTLEAKDHTIFVISDPAVALASLSRRYSHRDTHVIASTLPMFLQLSSPIPASLVDKDGFCQIDVFFDQEIQAEAKALRNNDLGSTSVAARLLNFDGELIGGWKHLTDASTLWDAEHSFGINWQEDEAWIAATMPAQRSARFVAMLDVIQSRSDEWCDSNIDVNRCSANVWIERDRKVLTLTNEFFGLDVFTIADEAVDDAIDSGHLTPPRHPRPTEEAWLPCLIDYANSVGFSLCGVYPQETAEAQETEAPRG